MSKKIMLALVVVVLLAAASVWVYRSAVASNAVTDRDLYTVQKVDFPVTVSAAGLLEAAKSVSITPPRIERMHGFKIAGMVEEGRRVSEGDFLVEFDSSDISRRLRDETANHQRVQEEYQNKRSNFEIQLRDLKLQLEQAKSDADKLDNKLGRQAELESAITVEETRIRRDAARERVALLEKKLKASARRAVSISKYRAATSVITRAAWTS
jgi:multidrug efflux pump subunit AcrA (membrane-fusion protein)